MTQLAVVTEEAAAAMNSRMTINLTATMKPLNRADSRIPTTSNIVTTTMMNIAGRLMTAPVDDQAWVLTSKSSGAEANRDGRSMPRSRAKLTT